MPQLRSRLLLYPCALIFLFGTVTRLSPVAHAQGMAPQPLGGVGTLDESTSAPSDHAARRRLPTELSAVPEDFAKLKLAPGFLLAMEVYDAPELSTDLRIDANGEVVVPMIGAVHVAGKTLTQASEAIATQLRDKKIMNQPQVNLNITQYSGVNVTVLGEVQNPGRIELLAPHTLAEVIALAGGETPHAGSSVEIVHHEDGAIHRQTVRYLRSKAGGEQADLLIMPGDTITVPRAGIVYVLGGVNRPGGYVMQEDGELSVTEAIALAYGTDMQAAVGSMRLIRKLPDGQVREIPINFREIMKGKEPSPRLQAEDVIYVPISKIKTVATAGLLTATAQAAIYAR